MIAVCVTFDIRPPHWEAFLPLMQAQADRSLKEEEGCHRFDICTDIDGLKRVFLYELYTDRAAFDRHLKTPHFISFDADVSDMIAVKDVAVFGHVRIG